MATTPLMRDEDLSPEAKAVFDDIRATRGTDFVNNVWRALAFHPEELKRTWEKAKEVMGTPGALDPVTREMIYIAVSAASTVTPRIAHSVQYVDATRTNSPRRVSFGSRGHLRMVNSIREHLV